MFLTMMLFTTINYEINGTSTSNNSSKTTSSSSETYSWKIGISYENITTDLVNNSIISYKAALVGYSNHSVAIGFVYVNGTQELTLENWQYIHSSPSEITFVNAKVSDGSSGDYDHPFSLTLGANLDPYIITMTLIDTQCNVKNVTYIEDTNNQTDTLYSSITNTNTTSFNGYSCVPQMPASITTTTTTVTKSTNFEPLLILPALVTLVLIRKRTVKKD